ncbi:hypothetical protein O3M35_008911 [Rhynocoris fuscipes]|uniref:SOSS complex subunit C n=1 Tax=Rhynocoris fuscipes TaxID=488301 RepID=A0AAW1DAB3_9HEMI
MALNPSRDITNRKILLEELEQSKKLLKQGVVTGINPSPTFTGSALPTGTSLNQAEVQNLSSAQRSALNLAHSQSYGYFITQDSSFGNTILPVLPRFDRK